MKMPINIIPQSKALVELSIAEIARRINNALLASIAASYFDNLFDVSEAAAILDNVNLLVTKAATIIQHENLSVDKAASIIDNTNFSADKVASICDSSNITSTKIRAILDTGILTVADKIAALLDGSSLTEDDAASHVNSGTYTDDLAASAFDSSYLAVARAASIFNNSNLSADKAASIADNANLTETRLQSILDNPNLSIQKGQEIVDAMSNPSKIGSGGRRGVIGDDWEDNKLTTRDGAAAVATTLEKIFQSFRPEWSITSGSDRVAAQNNRLEMWNVKDDITEVLMSISQTNTDLTCKFKWTFDKPSYKTQIRFIKTSGGDYYYVEGGAWSNSEKNITLCKNVGGSESILLDSGTASSATAGAPDQEVKVVKSGSNFELFVNGVSKGTATDSDITTSNVFEIRGRGGDLEDTGDSRCHIDNLEIY